MKFTADQIETLEGVINRLGAILLKSPMNDPLMVGLAKAYALAALAYTHAEQEKPINL